MTDDQQTTPEVDVVVAAKSTTPARPVAAVADDAGSWRPQARS